MSDHWWEFASIRQPSTAIPAYAIIAENAINAGSTVAESRLLDVTDPDNPADVSSTLLTGSAIIVGTTITTPLIGQLTADARYRLEIDVTDSGQTITVAGIIHCPY
jgi:hypothetical protein